MINGSYHEFFEKLSWGVELWFVYGGAKYLVQGYTENGTYNLYFFMVDPEGTGYDWIGNGTEQEYPVEEFLNAKLFDGKSFREIESVVEWVDC